MTITNQSLLKKIEDEVMKAKQINDTNMQKQYVYTIKTLCELILEQESTSTIVQTQTISQPSSTSLTYEKSQPLKTEDGSNGDSIFDF